MAQVDDVPVDSQFMDYAEHDRTYHRFLRMARNISIAVAVILILMAYFLV